MSTPEPECKVDARPTTPRRVRKDGKGRPMIVVPPSRIRAAGPPPRVTRKPE